MSTQPLDTPKAILLATDLSARSDRAFDRALQLAEHWQAKLVLLVVLSAESSFSKPNHFNQGDDDDEEVTAEELVADRVRAELPETDVKIEVHVEASAHIGQTALRVAEEYGCGLIVTGIARSDALQRVSLGSTVVWLSRHSTIPTLVVQRRPRGHYRHVGVATDLSEPAARAAVVAAKWFDDAKTRVLLHGYDVSFADLTGDEQTREAALADAQQQARQELTQWRDENLPKLFAPHWQPRAELSNPVRLLRQASIDTELDLAVLASHGRNRLMDALIGSVAKRLLETSITDTLIVRG